MLRPMTASLQRATLPATATIPGIQTVEVAMLLQETLATVVTAETVTIPVLETVLPATHPHLLQSLHLLRNQHLLRNLLRTCALIPYIR